MDQDTRTASPPKLEDLALDTVCHMGAALDVLELHSRHNQSAIIVVSRDLLRAYFAEADQAHAAEPGPEDMVCVLQDMSLNLGYAIDVLDHLNGDEADDPILYAVSYLLKAAKRFADEGVPAALP